MSPFELERAVAQATGESRREIRRRGFQPLPLAEESRDEVDAHLGVIDWDVLQAERPVLFPVR
ncbi:MAG: hypothetical protein JNL96_04680 [Planctomycetaceae bacterium]|nr:hypothetical protein [Planctomycetaceae bacterium]